MSSPSLDNLADAHEDRVDAAIAEFLQAADAGRPLDVSEFLTRHADIADELCEFLADHRGIQRMTSIHPIIPGYELGDELGRGGMGVVFAARRLTDGRDVAIKVLHPWWQLDASAVERFRREVRAVSRLQHPHIVPILDSGTAEHGPYLVMERIDGRPLNHGSVDGWHALRLCKGRGESPRPSMTLGVPPTELALRLADVAEALEESHRNGVIHRDVKPSNLLMTSDGRLLIGDFGLAHVAEEPSLTRTGDAVGSPAYMSPEQVSSRTQGTPIDHRTDIYSLGATLYELLTGRPPFVAESRNQLLAQIAAAEPLPPSQLRADIPRGLEFICLRAIEKSPQRRYSTAAEMAVDLRRFAAGQPTQAERHHTWTSLRRWWRRQSSRARTAASVAIVFVVFVSLGAIAWRNHRELSESRRQHAIDDALLAALSADLNAADREIAVAEQSGVSADWLEMLRGQVAFHRGDYHAAVEHLQSAVTAQPRHVAAQAMLATAHLAAGSWESYESSLAEIESLSATTAEDFLFKGQAESFLDPRLAVRTLDEAIRRRDTPLARLLRAEALTNLASDASDLAAAEAALTDAFIARHMLSKHPAALLQVLDSHAVAADLFRSVGQDARHVEELAAAKHVDRALDEFNHLPTVLHNRVLFRWRSNRDDDAFELLRQAESLHADPLIAYDLALAHARRGETKLALDVLNRRAARSNEFKPLTADEAFLRVWMLHETGDASAQSEYQQLAERFPNGLTALFRPALRLLMGQAVQAESESRDLRRTLQLPRLREVFYRRLLAFNSGEISAEDLLANVSDSRWNECEARFFVALKHRAAGDHAMADEQFARCLATRCAGFLAWDWSHVLMRETPIKK